MAGFATVHAEVPWFWTDQYDCNLQFAGAPTSWSDCVMRGDPASGRFALVAIEADRVTGAITVNSGRDMRFLRQFIALGLPPSRDRLADPACRLDTLIQQSKEIA
ncbi:Anthranilate 1,2-dioxygenase system ferredoxin--NAD(+) reductase component [Variovorax sp. SRS16]|uniref:oxidoreductase C-terminal domain-containing protein n=1 Tax=Variovorax sp. SRS16 TaxID=282217 RepID=UPI001317A265|nr:oxidoreductase C-terminal domain-containing protein [Variovorax sp. SRS16]VTU14969.1 Anthranilate 1,2-dioxygenase system ferredoxin--NAD(+) reductase component [Variovorax sp. SRS16]